MKIIEPPVHRAGGGTPHTKKSDFCTVGKRWDLQISSNPLEDINRAEYML